MRFFFRSISCWIKHGGHCWEFRHLTYCQGTGVVMRCIKCGTEMAVKTSQLGVK